MEITARKMPASFSRNDTVVIFLEERGEKKPGPYLPPGFEYVESTTDIGFFKGRQSETSFLPFSKHPRVILCGIGKIGEIDAESLRRSAASAVNLCREKSINSIQVVLPGKTGLDPGITIAAVAEGLHLGNYQFDAYKTKKDDDRTTPLRSARIFTDLRNAPDILRRVAIISRNTLLCRDLINETSDRSDSRGIARQAAALRSIPGVTCKIYGKRDLVKMKMGLLLAVNRGSKKPPHLVVLTYRGDRKNNRFLAVIGKGITFDSGGINLKPTGHIEDMRTDMAGAAAALYAFKSVAELGLRKNMYAVLPLTENMLSGEAYRPGDVFRSYRGLTVEIGNTDAEGRLILADAIAFTEKTLKPSCMIDIATLTGACLVTFGELVAAYLTRDDALASLLEESARATGESLWRLPLLKDYEENMKSDIADLCNISSEKNAGTIMGAIFLKNFVDGTPWAHIDIAGTARFSKQRGYRPKHATGYGVRLLVEAIASWK